MSSTEGRGTPTRITDPQAIAAITHPLRMRLLGELSRRGTARAVDLAAAVDEPANSVSFHLRQLARYGLIEQNPDRADNGRERWWRQTSVCGFEIDLDAMRQLDGGEAAVETVRRVAEGHVLALHRTIHPQADRGRGGQRTVDDPRHTISDDFAVRLSVTELQQMRLELQELFDRWGETSRALADAEDGQERHGYYGVVMAALESDLAVTYASQKGRRP